MSGVLPAGHVGVTAYQQSETLHMHGNTGLLEQREGGEEFAVEGSI